MNLSKLPSDIIRKIINMGQIEHIDCLRLISRRWNTLSIEYLSDIDRELLPSINMLRWHTSVKGIIIRMHMPSTLRTFFGVQSWTCLAASTNESEECVSVKSGRFTGVKALAKLFARCSSIERVEFNIDEHQEVHMNNLVIIAMGELPIRSLAITSHKHRPHQDCINNAKSVVWDFLGSYPTPIPRLIIMDNVLDINAIFAHNGWSQFIEETLRFVAQVQIKSHWATNWLCYYDLTNAFNSSGKFDATTELKTINIVTRKSTIIMLA